MSGEGVVEPALEDHRTRPQVGEDVRDRRFRGDGRGDGVPQWLDEPGARRSTDVRRASSVSDMPGAYSPRSKAMSPRLDGPAPDDRSSRRHMVYPEFGWLLDPSPVVCHKETVSIANARASLARAQGHLAGARRGGSDVPELRRP